MAPGGSLSSESASNNPNEGVLPEKEEYKIELKKDGNGLGITIAGYVCEKGKKIKKKNFLSKNIAVAQCGNVMVFLTFRFLCEIKF